MTINEKVKIMSAIGKEFVLILIAVLVFSSCDKNSTGGTSLQNGSAEPIVGSWHGRTIRDDGFDTTLISFNSDYSNPTIFVLSLTGAYYQTNVTEGTWKINNDTLTRVMISYKESRDSGKTWKDLPLTQNTMHYRLTINHDTLSILPIGKPSSSWLKLVRI